MQIPKIIRKYVYKDRDGEPIHKNIKNILTNHDIAVIQDAYLMLKDSHVSTDLVWERNSIVNDLEIILEKLQKKTNYNCGEWEVDDMVSKKPDNRTT